MFSFDSESPLPVSGEETYQGLAFDGCQFYLPIRCDCAVAVLDSALCFTETVITRRPYTAICFDPCRDCFWAISDPCQPTLFRLNRWLQEIDRLEFRPEGRCPGPFTGVSFCCESLNLLVSYGNQLLEVNPDTADAIFLCQAQDCSLILTVVCLPPFILFYALQGRTAHFVLASRDGKILDMKKARKGLSILAMVLDPCTFDLLLLANKHRCYPYLLRARLCNRLLDDLCPCNRDLYSRCKQACPCPPPCSRETVLESIALVEASIAHILNAEGEKLQKVIETSKSSCELLQVNESVQRTILYATQLEQLLLSKLEALRSLSCLCEPEDCLCREED